MIGNTAIPVIAEVYAKGFRDFNTEAAFAMMKRSSSTDPAEISEYCRLGWLSPTGTRDPTYGASVSRTLGCVYDDASLATFGSALGKTEDAVFFAKH